MAHDGEIALSCDPVNDKSVNGDDHARSLGSKRARITKSNEEFADDRLSELPDELLLHILLSLCTKQAAQTSVLSKRWQFLWIDLPVIVLRETNREIKVNRSFVDCVGRILDTRGGTHVNALYVDLWFRKSFTSNVDLWVEFVVKNKVKDFTLNCRSKSSSGNVYVLPQILYSNVFLTTLAVHGCAIAPQRAIEWGFLKSLSFQSVRLQQSVIENILSGCPVLEALRLSGCWGVRQLEINSSSITTLVIDDWRKPLRQFFALGITAPYVRVLTLSDDMALRFSVEHCSSLVSAKVDYRFPEDSATPARVDSSLMTNMLGLLWSWCSVKELELGPLCIEVLASLEEWGLDISLSTRLCLTLTAWRHKRSIHGILKILKSSPALETLVIRWTSFERQLIPITNYSQNGKLDLVLPLLCHLKFVSISGFSETGLAGEPMLTLVQLLLNSAPSLEQMVISAKDLTGYSPTNSSSTDFSKVAQKLLSFPRASPKAIVMVR